MSYPACLQINCCIKDVPETGARHENKLTGILRCLSGGGEKGESGVREQEKQGDMGNLPSPEVRTPIGHTVWYSLAGRGRGTGLGAGLDKVQLSVQ